MTEAFYLEFTGYLQRAAATWALPAVLLGALAGLVWGYDVGLGTFAGGLLVGLFCRWRVSRYVVTSYEEASTRIRPRTGPGPSTGQ
jgi:hypothetical protein